MKTKSEILQELIDRSEETLTRIELRMGFVQNKYAETNGKRELEELAQLTADQKEHNEWLKYLKSQLTKAN